CPISSPASTTSSTAPAIRPASNPAFQTFPCIALFPPMGPIPRGMNTRANPFVRLTRQGRELAVVQVRQLHAPCAPVSFGLLDPLLARGNEIPLDEARAQRLPAKRHDDRRSTRRDDARLSFGKDRHF